MRERSDQELEQLFALDGNAGPARPIDDRRASAIIGGALGGAGFPSPASGGGTSGGAATGGKAALAVKLAIVTGGLATIAVVAWIALRDKPHAAITAPPAAPIVAVAPPPVVAPEPPPAAAPQPAPAENSADDDAAAEPAEPIDTAPEKPPTPTKAKAHAATQKQLDDLLAKANAQRAAHAWKAADELYARVSASAPTGLAGQTALVASATLHLEHLNDPAGAERRFRAVLAHPGGLAEDARWGLAECARAKGDAPAEKRALSDFLAHHPSSAIAPRAHARLAELSP